MQSIRNIIYIYSLCLPLFLYTFSFGSVECSETPFYQNYELAVENSHDKIGLLDTFIDMGIQSKELTGERISYKKCIKLAYKKIQEAGHKISKEDKKNFENAFYIRLEQRFATNDGNKVLGCQAYVDPRGPKERQSDSNFKESIALVGVGTIAQFVPCGATNFLGGIAIGKG
jgi:hypothetical protein